MIPLKKVRAQANARRHRTASRFSAIGEWADVSASSPKILDRLLTCKSVAEVKVYSVSQETIRLDCADRLRALAHGQVHTLNLEHPSAELGV